LRENLIHQRFYMLVQARRFEFKEFQDFIALGIKVFYFFYLRADAANVFFSISLIALH